jgi:hypothetical protein
VQLTTVIWDVASVGPALLDDELPLVADLYECEVLWLLLQPPPPLLL